jgi:hypothetical protein
MEEDDDEEDAEDGNDGGDIAKDAATANTKPRRSEATASSYSQANTNGVIGS